MLGFRPKRRLQDRYQITGFISSGTYGRVFKAKGIKPYSGVFAIKKFKPDREGEPTYTGISQSATREMALCAELRHPNIIEHVETFLQDKAIIMVFAYCEHDLLQIIHYHSSQQQQHHLHQHQQPSQSSSQQLKSAPSTPLPASPSAIPPTTVRSILYQLLLGVSHLHRSWVMHRDLKPANIMVTSSGRVQIGDLGLARIFRSPKTTLYSGDKVVVTIWYRAPELLLGARHYTPAIDLWAVGCIFAELIALRPIFKGEEAKPGDAAHRAAVNAAALAAMASNNSNQQHQHQQQPGGGAFGGGGAGVGDRGSGNPAAIDAATLKKQVPFQTHQVRKIVEILGVPTLEEWPTLTAHPDYPTFAAQFLNPGASHKVSKPIRLDKWYQTQISGRYGTGAASPGEIGFDLLRKLLSWDPERRLTAEQALAHPYFAETNGGKVATDCFDGSGITYPKRKVNSEGAAAAGGGAGGAAMVGSEATGSKRGAGAEDSVGPSKRMRGH